MFGRVIISYNVLNLGLSGDTGFRRFYVRRKDEDSAGWDKTLIYDNVFVLKNRLEIP